MKKYIQIYIGGVSGRNITWHEIEEKLSLFQEKKPDGIIVGWSLDIAIYKQLREYAKKHQIEYYLWFQVFSEFKNLKKFNPVQDSNGNQIHSILFDGDEDFSFYCPSQPNTLLYLTQIYEENFEEIGFDGIFLDRIRFPSLAFGEDALFSCCCEACMKKYYQSGIRKEEIKEIQSFLERNRKENTMLDIVKYEDGAYVFRYQLLEKYLCARANLITETVKELCDYFKKKGLKVGLDLFAPFLAILVGQDYKQLSQYADFVKPMLYRYTETPAGIKYELDSMIQSLSEENKQKAKKQFLEKILNLDEKEMSKFVLSEIESAKKMTKCSLMIGMEIHTLKEFSPITPQQVRESVKTLDKVLVDGRVASWNILLAEKDNIIAFMEGEK